MVGFSRVQMYLAMGTANPEIIFHNMDQGLMPC